MYHFEEVFNALLKGAITDAKQQERLIDQDRYEVLHAVYDEVSALFGTGVKLKFHPAFASGAVTVEVQEVRLEDTEVLKFKTILQKCSSLEVYPLATGGLRAAVTVKGVFK